MFLINTKIKTLIMLLLINTISFGCDRSPTPPPTPQPILPTNLPSPIDTSVTPLNTQIPPTPTPLTPPPISITPTPLPTVVVSPTDQFTPTAAFFLLDSSYSVRDLCESDVKAWIEQIPEFFITYAQAYHYGERQRDEEFQIGWQTFPNPTNNPPEMDLRPLSTFTNYVEWSSELKSEVTNYTNGLEFASTLTNLKEKLNSSEYNNYQKIIFLISDTYLQYQTDSSSVNDEKNSITTIIENFPADWRLYIIQLPCSKKDDYVLDREFWEVFANDRNIRVLERSDLGKFQDVIEALFNHNDDPVIQNLLPWDPKIEAHKGNPPTARSYLQELKKQLEQSWEIRKRYQAKYDQLNSDLGN